MFELSRYAFVEGIAATLLVAFASACGDSGPTAAMDADGLRHSQRIDVEGWDRQERPLAVDESTLVFGLDHGAYSEGAFDFNTGQEFQEFGALLVFERSGDLWHEAAFLTYVAPALSRLGDRIAVDDGIILASVNKALPPNHDIAVFERVDGQWELADVWEDVTRCEPDLAIADDMAVIADGCFADASVYQRTAAGWQHTQGLRTSRSTGVFSRPITLGFDGSTVVMGMPESNLVFVFERSGDAFVETQILEPPAPDELPLFGSSVDVSGDRIAISAPGSFQDRGGEVYIYERRAGQWLQTSRPEPNNFEDVIDWGSNLALRGFRLLVGAPSERTRQAGVDQTPDPHRTTDRPGYGAAYLFEEVEGDWVQRYYLKSASPKEFEHFGAVVALTDDQVLVASPDGRQVGYVHVWTHADLP